MFKTSELQKIGPDGLSALQHLLLKDSIPQDYLTDIRQNWEGETSLETILLQFGHHQLSEMKNLSEDDVRAAARSDNIDTVESVLEKIQTGRILESMKEEVSARKVQSICKKLKLEAPLCENEDLKLLLERYPRFNDKVETSVDIAFEIYGSLRVGAIMKNVLAPLCPLRNISNEQVEIGRLNLLDYCTTDCNQ